MSTATEFVKFVNRSPSPFHAVAQVRALLEEKQFVKLLESEDWSSKLVPNGKYYFTRNQSSIFAFAVGGKWVPGNGFAIVGAHTDSPCLKLKPNSKKNKSGYLQVGVQLYGGGLWHTWFDRDLAVAGRVMRRTTSGTIVHENVRIDKPILRIPTLAIHLDRGVNTEGFKFNLESQLQPVLGIEPSTAAETSESTHQPALLQLISKTLNCNPADIADFELCLYDVQPSTVGGINDEFVYSPRIDNLGMSFCGVHGLVQSLNGVPDSSQIRMLALFDNEEVGSQSAYGADSLLLEATFRRILSALAKESQHAPLFEMSMANSFLISADMAHAIHPNYPEKHEENHRPQMNKGPVIKVNANQRYATTAVTSLIFKEIAKKDNVPVQEFVVRNDSPCGSTIGPMLSAHLGVRTVDIGNAQLSMHSIREQAGAHDFDHAIKLFKSFFNNLANTDKQVYVDNV